MIRLKSATWSDFAQIYRSKLPLILLIGLLASTIDPKDGAPNERAKPRPGAFIRTPDLTSIATLLHPHLMPPVVQLHLLLALRLLSMVCEDAVHSISLQSHTVSAGTVAASTSLCVAGVTAAAVFVSSLGFREMLRTFALGDVNPDGPVLNLRAIVFVEGIATALNAVMMFSKLESAPTHVKLPSPSHAPSLAEALRVPPTVTDFLSGRVVVAPEPPDGVRRRPAGMAARRQRNFFAPAGVDQAPNPPAQPSAQLQNPLRLQSAAQADPKRPGKAPRQRGKFVMVETPWLFDVLGMLLTHMLTSIQYGVVVISLPSLAPTSLPPLLALLALRSELAQCVSIWTTARGSVEALEFVNRRWTGEWASTELPADLGPQVCAVCFEQVIHHDSPPIAATPEDAKDEQRARARGACRLDCGHELHPVCLVSWLAKQSFCPVCFVALSATPPKAAARLRTSTS